MKHRVSNLWMVFSSCISILSTGCGAIDKASALFSHDELPEKVRCPGSHDGFYVCLSSESNFSDSGVQSAVEQGLAKLATLVNEATFQSEIKSAISTGDSIVTNLTATNYIVSVTGYCEPQGDALARAVVDGNTIDYNECRVSHDSSGQPDVAEVAGVLLHEISHNIGYTHPEVDPSRLTIPYFLGDTAEKDISGVEKPISERRAADRTTKTPTIRRGTRGSYRYQ